MGADLIGYILVGPPSLDEGLKDSAISAAQERIDAATKWCALKDPSEEDFAPLEKFGFEDEFDAEWASGQDAESAVEEFMELWDEGARDAMDRIISDPPMKVLSTGEMSWGDEPEGSFQTAKAAIMLGIAEIFGVH